MERLAIRAKGITKRFPGQIALDQVDLLVPQGEVTALVGENGAGKSTLIKLLAGELTPDEGEIQIFDEAVDFHSPSDALGKGLGFIHQVPALVGTASVTENVVLGQPFRRHRWGGIDWSRQHLDAAEVLQRVGLDHVLPRQRLSELTVSEQQLVALARLLHSQARVLVLDEATASLTGVETDRLFAILTELVADGLSVVYVSHRLDEVFRIADSVTVLRNGRLIARRRISELSPAKLTELIVGKEFVDVFAKRHHLSPAVGPPRLIVEGLRSERLKGVSLSLRRGEVLGLAGLAGAGRSEVLRALFGAEPATSGSISLEGEVLSPTHPSQAIRAGLALVTEDRKLDGFSNNAKMWEAALLPRLGEFRSGPLLSLPRAKQTAAEMATNFDVRPPNPNADMANFSGGNQQKVLLARWINPSTKVLLLDEPTHGVDVGAKAAIYELILEAVAAGLSVIMASSDADEFAVLCDRVVLLSDGAVLGELSGEEISTREILRCLLARQAPGGGAVKGIHEQPRS